MLRIHQHLGELRDEDRLAAWVFRIARNVITDHYRANGKTVTHLASDEELGATTEGISGPNFNARIASWLPAAIEQLPEAQREAVQLFELQGIPQQEIARRLGLTLTAVKSRVRRGRAALAKVINECCKFELDRRGNILDYQQRQQNCCECSG
ncbi:MAG: sigma-70 family RNA polymerase sigma factor [Pirellulales bacterium]|nr:sigma-70 family RNA polymerase sigma factor [Pirellulales bacterium]